MSVGLFQNAEEATKFMLAGNARVTIVSKKTGTRFTYRVRKPNEDAPNFVQLLTGNDNERDYTYLGLIGSSKKYAHGRKSPITPEATSNVAFNWAWAQLSTGNLPESIEVWHEGKCGRCGRPLTDPASIESGFGPECITKV